MLRTVSKQQLRRFATQSARLAEAAPVAAPVTPAAAPKRFSLGKFLFKTTFYGSSLYALAVAAAMYNDEANDFVVENLPGAPAVIKLVEDYQSNGGHLQFDETFKKLNIESITKKIEAKIPDASQIVAKVSAKKPLPTLETSSNETLAPTFAALNQLIAAINNSSASDETVAAVAASLTQLSVKVDGLTANREQELAKLTAAKVQALEATFAAKENASTEKFLQDFQTEKRALEAKHDAQLAAELAAAQATIAQAATNAVDAIKVEQVKQFAVIVEQKVAEERAGKLAQLDVLAANLDSLADVVAQLEGHLDRAASATAVQTQLVRVKALLASPQPQGFAADLAALQELTAHDPLASAALASVPRESAINGCLTVPQLITRWQLLVPELRSAALLPPNAGLLGHLSSIVFSKLLLSKKGHANGNDIESVIARVENYLTRGDLADAVEEAASLKGWSRKLANGWVNESRKRLEVEFLLSVVEAGARA
ncbi:hypothetical protein BABINDRAFT_46752 [Babjeviella inositovora NRRL Y-12698]|uniref:MICOS complex subunit MIC60 n=1 Tax=Babjeviella inositovora NRRL Y-12698 TaxID=984486 RepID=A0A1E3QTQ1_9ASCO|nr:uncharacterized protein BABINDRAFT_46752 [Babjeviella inositovora NRRL Y-12698]ODQ81056.1 hypothetical protein BABINDRAFT_46752 [Babjeviella inositovora NRRL Y-12698]